MCQTISLIITDFLEFNWTEKHQEKPKDGKFNLRGKISKFVLIECK
jgi:hypothetical protein